MGPKDESGHFESWSIPLERVGAQFAVNNKTLEVQRNPDFIHELTMFHIRALIPALTKREAVSFPADWWQAVKERWFPAWAKRRWPVRYTTIDAKAFFPDAVVPKSDRMGSPAFAFTDYDEFQL